MPYAPHYRVTVTGEFRAAAGAVEQFQWGFSATQSESVANAPSTAMLDKLEQELGQFWGAGEASFSASTPITEIKVARIGTDGTYTADPAIRATNIAGGNTGRTYPPQVAIVASLVTPRRGATGRGRCFFPAPAGAALAADWTLGSGYPQNLANVFAEFLRDLQTSTNPALQPGLLNACVASTKGYNTPVSGVRVGTVLDTMRSRRRAMQESYGATIQA
jgi:hypothetical protein